MRRQEFSGESESGAIRERAIQYVCDVATSVLPHVLALRSRYSTVPTSPFVFPWIL